MKNNFNEMVRHWRVTRNMKGLVKIRAGLGPASVHSRFRLFVLIQAAFDKNEG